MLIMNILERTSYIKQAGIMHKKREESKNLLIKAAVRWILLLQHLRGVGIFR